MKFFDRITINPAQMGGMPCLRGLRIPVATVLRLLAGGISEQAILADYPDLPTGAGLSPLIVEPTEAAIIAAIVAISHQPVFRISGVDDALRQCVKSSC